MTNLMNLEVAKIPGISFMGTLVLLMCPSSCRRRELTWTAIRSGYREALRIQKPFARFLPLRAAVARDGSMHKEVVGEMRCPGVIALHRARLSAHGGNVSPRRSNISRVGRLIGIVLLTPSAM
jgi:hypothetical protein